MNLKTLTLGAVACLAAGAATPSFAAMTDAQCDAAFVAADTNKDGMLTEAEATRYYAYARIASKPVTGTTMSKADFMSQCRSGLYDEAKAEAGAPFAGANSFTEAQAKDRLVARGFTNVSALQKDDKGVWRGTAMHDSKSANVAVDYKGNVVGN